MRVRPQHYWRREVREGRPERFAGVDEVCAATAVRAGTELAFGGAVVVDTDGPFLEVHPEDDFRIVTGGQKLSREAR
jgi:hypothetical protein